MSPGREIRDAVEVAALLRRVRSVAVLGAHEDSSRPAFYVPDYLAHQGYRVQGVNPALVGRNLFGRPVLGSLAELPEAPDLVDVFRRPELLPAHLPELVALAARRLEGMPAMVVWFQSGIRHDAVAAALRDAGADVVQDRCTYADHRALRVGPVQAT